MGELLDARVLTLGDIADAVQVSSAALARYKAGQSKPHPDIGRRLAAFLGITLDELYAAYDRGAAARKAAKTET